MKTKEITRTAWEQLNHLEQSRFISEGGKVFDEPETPTDRGSFT